MGRNRQVLHFVVPGPPRPKQRPRMGRRGRVYTPQKTQDYERSVAEFCRAATTDYPKHWHKSSAKRMGIAIVFRFRDKRKRDLDNLVKSILDGINKAGVWDDDSQIDEVIARREMVNDPTMTRDEQNALVGAEIWIWKLNESLSPWPKSWLQRRWELS